MTYKLPYEKIIEQKLYNADIPDTEAAWQNMRLLLDKEHEERMIPAIWYKGCAIALLIIGLGAAVWFWLLPQKDMNKETRIKTSTEISIEKNNKAYKSRNKNAEDTITNKSIINNYRDSNSVVYNNNSDNKSQIDVSEESSSRSNTNKKFTRNKKFKTDSKAKSTVMTANSDENKLQDTNYVVTNDKEIIKDSASTSGDVKKIVQQLTDTVKQNNSTIIEQQKTEKKKNKSSANQYYFSAGAGLQQQIPINDQKAVPYNYLGRKSSLSDYIPSLYVSFHRDKKWFINTGFRFGAPSLTRQIIYADTAISFGPTPLKRSLKLNKTYYHQVPLSFNFFILPNWSVGAGVQTAKFYSAVSLEEIKRSNPSTGVDTLISSKLIRTPAKNDSLFKKVIFSNLLETRFEWKKFSTGIRYTYDLTPFIRYTINSVAKKERNQSLQLFITYRLLQSKKK